MFPWVYGFTWQTGNLIFLTIFYMVAAAIFSTFAVAIVRTIRDVRSGRTDEIRWHTDFNDLPDFAKSCRAVFSGETGTCVCRNAFDCRTCERRWDLVRTSHTVHRAGIKPAIPGDAVVLGVAVPVDRLYHRGHTWVRKGSDGTLTVGLDELGKRLLDASAEAELPETGKRLSVNGPAWFFRSESSRFRILSPVDGEVVSIGGKGKDFYLKVNPGRDYDLRHLLKGSEILPWMTRELERLEIALGSGSGGVNLADGGDLVEDLHSNYPDTDWDSVTAEMFLEM